jgi:hypothetical protein
MLTLLLHVQCQLFMGQFLQRGKTRNSAVYSAQKEINLRRGLSPAVSQVALQFVPPWQFCSAAGIIFAQLRSSPEMPPIQTAESADTIEVR